MVMIMNFFVMTSMVMLVLTMIFGVFVVVNLGITAMSVLVEVLVQMVMRVSMGVLVAVFFLSMRMFVSVLVGMLMPV